MDSSKTLFYAEKKEEKKYDKILLLLTRNHANIIKKHVYL